MNIEDADVTDSLRVRRASILTCYEHDTFIRYFRLLEHHTRYLSIANPTKQ